MESIIKRSLNIFKKTYFRNEKFFEKYNFLSGNVSGYRENALDKNGKSKIIGNNVFSPRIKKVKKIFKKDDSEQAKYVLTIHPKLPNNIKGRIRRNKIKEIELDIDSMSMDEIIDKVKLVLNMTNEEIMEYFGIKRKWFSRKTLDFLDNHDDKVRRHRIFEEKVITSLKESEKLDKLIEIKNNDIDLKKMTEEELKEILNEIICMTDEEVRKKLGINRESFIEEVLECLNEKSKNESVDGDLVKLRDDGIVIRKKKFVYLKGEKNTAMLDIEKRPFMKKRIINSCRLFRDHFWGYTSFYDDPTKEDVSHYNWYLEGEPMELLKNIKEEIRKRRSRIVGNSSFSPRIRRVAVWDTTIENGNAFCPIGKYKYFLTLHPVLHDGIQEIISEENVNEVEIETELSHDYEFIGKVEKMIREFLELTNAEVLQKYIKDPSIFSKESLDIMNKVDERNRKIEELELEFETAEKEDVLGF